MKTDMMRIAVPIALLLACVPCIGYASADNWGWALLAYSAGQDSGCTGGFGVFPESLDGWDSHDRMVVSGPKAYLGTYHGSEPGIWAGSGGFYPYDYRAPLARTPGLSQTWVLYVWADPALPVSATPIHFVWLRSRTPPDWLRFRLTLRSKPEGIMEGPALGAVWDLSAQPDGGAALPVFRTLNGLEGYVFEFTAIVMPEPASLAALLAGLTGLGGLALRRRRG